MKSVIVTVFFESIFSCNSFLLNVPLNKNLSTAILPSLLKEESHPCNIDRRWDANLKKKKEKRLEWPKCIGQWLWRNSPSPDPKTSPIPVLYSCCPTRWVPPVFSVHLRITPLSAAPPRTIYLLYTDIQSFTYLSAEDNIMHSFFFFSSLSLVCLSRNH